MSNEVVFSNTEKMEAFDVIAQRYFNRNFGTVSKADFETLLFSIYLEHLLKSGEKYDDYSVSKALGITQSKVRSMKIKKELQYPHEDGGQWKGAFVQAIEYATYDDDTRMVTMLIEDPNIQTELRYFIESNHWYDEIPSNYKLFRCRLDFFLKICEKLSDDNVITLNKNQEEKIKTIKKADSKEKTAIEKILSGNILGGLNELAKIGTKETVCAVLEYIPIGGITGVALKALVEIMKKAL